MPERRRANRRLRQVRNLYSYLTRRERARKGRRKDERTYDDTEDWFDDEETARPNSDQNSPESSIQ